MNDSFPGVIIPDNTPQQIDNDADLTSDLPSDAEELDLVHLKVGALAELGLPRFRNLKLICLRQNLIDSIADIKLVRNKELVEELDFYDNRINHISKHVSEFRNLLVLDLSFNKIKSIKNLEGVGKLRKLFFVQNKISHIENIEHLTSLETLELGGNRVESIGEVMLKMTSLTDLWLGKNYISRIRNLDHLSNLKVLSIQSNRLTEISGLAGLTNLEELYMSHNGIEKIENLEKNTNLQILDITGNKIHHLENLAHLTQLTDLWCSDNQIASFQEVERELGHLPNLETVYLERNPLQTQNATSYRRKLKLILGDSLQKIDSTYC